MCTMLKTVSAVQMVKWNTSYIYIQLANRLIGSSNLDPTKGTIIADLFKYNLISVSLNYMLIVAGWTDKSIYSAGKSAKSKIYDDILHKYSICSTNHLNDIFAVYRHRLLQVLFIIITTY